MDSAAANLHRPVPGGVRHHGAELDPGHNEADGGALRLHLPDGAVDVPPRGGTLVLFLSAEIEHEVLPTTRERLSIAGWFRRRAA